MRHTRLGLSLAALFMSALAAAATRGELANSPWIASQRLEADKTLGSTAADLLVVPVQCDKEGFDPIERSLITRLVSDHLVRTAGILVPNPTVVFREFGAFRSVYPQEDIDDVDRFRDRVEIRVGGLTQYLCHPRIHGNDMVAAAL